MKNTKTERGFALGREALNHNCNTSIGINSLMDNTTGTSMNYSHGKKNCDCKEPCNANTCIGRITDFNK